MRENESAGGVVVGPDGRIVLVEQHNNSWSLPKGGVETGETLLEAAKREIYEETGLSNLVLVGELGSFERKSIGLDGKSETDEFGVRRRTFFLFTTPETELMPHDKEASAARWVSPEEAIELLSHPKDKEFLRSVLPKVKSAIQ